MTSILEQRFSSSLRTVLADLPVSANIPDSEAYRDVLTALQYYIPVVLGELYREWLFQGLDDIVPIEARKTGEGEVEILGICCFICDQTLTPMHIHLQVAASVNEISWLECRLGTQGQDGMERKPYDSLGEMTKILKRLDGQANLINWVYKVIFGERQR